MPVSQPDSSVSVVTSQVMCSVTAQDHGDVLIVEGWAAWRRTVIRETDKGLLTGAGGAPESSEPFV